MQPYGNGAMDRTEDMDDGIVNGYRILLVEPDPDWQSSLFQGIQDHLRLEPAGHVETCADARRALQSEAIDAMVIDPELPDGSGIDVVREAANRHVPALVFTCGETPEQVRDALSAGASGYLLKRWTGHDAAFWLARTVLGERPLDSRITSHLIRAVIDDDPDPAHPHAERLTPREREVLQLLARGYSHRECATALQRSPHTVTTHIKNIYGKLEVGSRGALISKAISYGLVDPATLWPMDDPG